MSNIIIVKSLLLILCFFIISGEPKAQTKCEEKPVNERDVFFLYGEFGLSNSTNLKVMVISSHIYRYKYDYGYECPVLIDGVKAPLSNAFSAKMDEIKNNEYNPSADNRFNQVMKKNVALEFAFSDGVIAKGTGPELYVTVSSATEYIKKAREKVISNYKDKGYKILQVSFGEYFDDHLLQMKLEKVEKLSPLWIDEYRSGSIRALAIPYQGGKKSNESSGSITIESSKEKDNDKSNNSTTPKKDDTDWAAVVAMNRLEAEALEAEGNRLYNMGTMFYMAALKKYEEAQRLYPTPRVQARLNEINSWVAVGKGIIAAGEKIEQGIEKLDPNKKTRNLFGFVNYTGFLGSYNKIANTADQAPMDAFFGVSMHRVFISLELRFGYMVTPIYEYQLGEMNRSTGSVELSAEKVRIRQSGIGSGFSGGVNIPLSNVVVYGLYGIDFIFATVKNKVLTPEYFVDENPTYPWCINKWKVGILFKIPKTKIGIGLNYNLNAIKSKEEDGSSVVKHAKYPDRRFYLRKTTNDVYKFNNAGISFVWSP